MAHRSHQQPQLSEQEDLILRGIYYSLTYLMGYGSV